MDTINIINNSDQKLLMGNILVMNQKKLLDTIIGMSETDGSELQELLYDIMEFEYLKGSEQPNKSIQKIIDFIDKQKILNWEMFVDLINLDTSFYYQGHQTKSLYYLIEKQQTHLLYFLLSLDEGIIRWDIKLKGQKSNIFIIMIKKLWWAEDLMRQIINSKYFLNVLKNPDQQKHTLLYWMVSKCSEFIIMEAISLGLLNLNWEDTNSNQLVHWACKRNFSNLFDYLILNGVDLECTNKNLRRPIHLACIKNNIHIVKLLVENDVDLEKSDVYSKKPIDYAIRYSSSELVHMILDKQVEMEPNLFYDVLNYQDSGIINWFLSNKSVDLSESNFLWVTAKLVFRGFYTQTLSYSMIKINKWVDNYLENSQEGMYIQGKCF